MLKQFEEFRSTVGNISIAGLILIFIKSQIGVFLFITRTDLIALSNNHPFFDVF